MNRLEVLIQEHPQFQCPDCRRSDFTAISRLKSHVKKDHTIEKCPVCGDRFGENPAGHFRYKTDIPHLVWFYLLSNDRRKEDVEKFRTAYNHAINLLSCNGSENSKWFEYFGDKVTFNCLTVSDKGVEV